LHDYDDGANDNKMFYSTYIMLVSGIDVASNFAWTQPKNRGDIEASRGVWGGDRS